MSHSITLNFATLAELSAAVAKLAGDPPAASASAVSPSPAPSPSPSPKAKAAAKAADPVVSEEPAPSPAPAPAAAAKPPAVDYPTLQKAVFELAGLVQKRGLDSAEHVLSIARSLGAPNFKGLDPSKWDEALAAVKAKNAEVAALEAEVA